MKTGKIIPNGIMLEKHEYETILFLTNLGYDIELIRPSNMPKMKTPDFNMLGKSWEAKSPQGKNLTTIEHAFKRAAKQSENIILDLKRTKIPTKRAVEYIQKLFNASRRVKNLLVITKENKLIDFRH